ncbi:MAG: ABC transporter substrate-binding protein [Acidimicrobiales bacterium]|nr:ABC transporter substrate-binding protein [Acidimicrobiales bacterium]
MWRAWVATVVLVLVALPAVMGATSPGGGGGDDTVPGVTDDAVRVAFVTVDLTATQAALGFRTAPQGDPEAQVHALTDQINATGGIGGRELVPVVRRYEALDDSPEAEQALCDAITQDDEVFAVVLVGQFQPNARPCYAGRDTLMLDATLVPQDTQAYEDLHPYLWSASFPSYDDWARSLVTALVAADRVSGSRIGVVLADTPTDHRVLDDVLTPSLQEGGAATVVPAPIDTTDIGTLNVGLQQAIVTFRSQGVDQVLFLGGARLAPFFLTAASVQEFHSDLALTTFDNPEFIIKNPESVAQGSVPGSIGVGFQPGQDVFDDVLPVPFSDAETTCLDWLAAGGVTFPSRAESRTAILYCDAVRLLQAGAEGLGEPDALDAEGWAASVQALGDRFQSGVAFRTYFDEGRWAGGSAVRVMAHDATCNCFRYEGDDVVLAG